MERGKKKKKGFKRRAHDENQRKERSPREEA